MTEEAVRVRKVPGVWLFVQQIDRENGRMMLKAKDPRDLDDFHVGYLHVPPGYSAEVVEGDARSAAKVAGLVWLCTAIESLELFLARAHKWVEERARVD